MRDTFNVPYDLFPPLLIKLLITFGCYRHQGDIPQVLSAAWAQKNPHRGTSLSPPIFLSRSCRQLHTAHSNFIHSAQFFVHSSSPEQRYFWGVISHRSFKVRFKLANAGYKWFLSLLPTILLPPPAFPSVGPPVWLHCRGFCSPSSCLEMRTRHGPLRAFTRYCYVSEPIN